jgi:hypothetical protein
VPAALHVLARRQGAAALPLRLVWGLPLLLWLTPLFFAHARLTRSVNWRGRRYELDTEGRLATRLGRRERHALRRAPGRTNRATV